MKRLSSLLVTRLVTSYKLLLVVCGVMLAVVGMQDRAHAQVCNPDIEVTSKSRTFFYLEKPYDGKRDEASLAGFNYWISSSDGFE